MAGQPTLIKKYGNRRLYDTGRSRHITLDELAEKIQGGEDVRVVDAKSGEDLTQTTLTQLIIEGRQVARLLPVPLLLQLIRLGDDALAEFFGRYVTGALELYLQVRKGAGAVSQLNPFATLPFAASDAIARMWMSSPFGGRDPTPPPMPIQAVEEPAASADDVAALRREIAELRETMTDSPKPKKPRSSTRRKKS